MSKQTLSDFERGYEYACRHYQRLLALTSAKELLELARALAQNTGMNAELARGMAAYCQEMARRKKRDDVRP
ncbi:MAG: hypothetical protein P4N59_03275 [Negativicutes bacterium]|nr:hypothetical protein [Negativicutes bacterium]